MGIEGEREERRGKAVVEEDEKVQYRYYIISGSEQKARGRGSPSNDLTQNRCSLQVIARTRRDTAVLLLSLRPF